jgi:hypothetical protein
MVCTFKWYINNNSYEHHILHRDQILLVAMFGCKHFPGKIFFESMKTLF